MSKYLKFALCLLALFSFSLSFGSCRGGSTVQTPPDEESPDEEIPDIAWQPDSLWRPDSWQPGNIWRPENASATGTKLKDIYFFYRNGEDRSLKTSNLQSWEQAWSGGSQLTEEVSVINDLQDGKRVYSASGSGQIMFPFHDWAAFSLEQYYNNGVIEFDIRGNTGNVNSFSIGIKTKAKDVDVTHSVNLSRYPYTIGTTWQHVRIPIKDIADSPNSPSSPNKQFSLGDVWYVEFSNVTKDNFYISDAKISSTDKEIQYPVIKVDQTGYRPNDVKYALVSYFPGTLSGPADMSTGTEFRVISRDGVTKYTGNLTLVANTDPTSGERVFRADFSSLQEEGDYYISITSPQVNNSFKFSINQNVYGGLFVDSIRYFYYQRQGLDLTAQYAGPFARKNLHPNDTKVKKWSERSNGSAPTYDLSQGWYDAGDFGKYLLPAATTVSDLLFAYETFPALFVDNQLTIPESGNGGPDFLDEIKWELDMMLKFEDGTTGGFWHVANYDNNTNIIYIIDTNGVGGTGNTKGTAATAGAAAVLAHAYIVYKDIPKYADFAAKCLAASERAWVYVAGLPENTNNWVDGAGRGYQEQIQTVNIMKFWAACALYRATGDAKYNSYVKSRYNDAASFAVDNKSRFDSSKVLSNGSLSAAFIHYVKAKQQAGYDSAVEVYFKNQFTTFQNGILGYYNSKNWPTMLVDWGYWWGSNDPICRSPAELYLSNLVLGQDTKKSVELIRDSVHYLLGINPLAFSFVSGYGGYSVKNIFSSIYSRNYDKSKGFDAYSIPPGYMAGGASMYDLGFSSNWGSKSYVDSDNEWTTNENAIYWNAALVLLLTLNLGTAL